MTEERHDDDCGRQIRSLRRALWHLTRRVRTLELEVAGLESGPAAHATLTIEGADMAGATLSIDATDGTATLAYTDDKGDPATAPTDAATVFSSDTPTVATVSAGTDPLVATVTPVALGTANISVTGLGTDTLTSTPIADPAAVAVTIIAGPAASGGLVIAG
jgi:hypothetical protein